MIPVRIAVPLSLLACWDAWRLLLARADDEAAAVTLAALVATLGWRAWNRRDETVSPTLPAAMLAAYAVASWTGPALLQIGAAVATLVTMLWTRGRWPVLGAALLALPVLPTLDFLLAYPLRRVSAAITTAMLRLNGFDVHAEGVALAWNGRELLFDGPCSGVRMLWAALILASFVAFARGIGTWGHLRLLVGAALLALFGNALRAAALFYLEAGLFPRLHGPVAHEAVGIVAFALLALPLLAFAARPIRSPA